MLPCCAPRRLRTTQLGSGASGFPLATAAPTAGVLWVRSHKRSILEAARVCKLHAGCSKNLLSSRWGTMNKPWIAVLG